MSQHDDIEHRQVLVVEDEPVIAMDLAAELQDHGHQVAGPFARCREAMAWLASSQPDCAVIDVALEDGSGLEIGRELRRRGIPFVFFSGAEGLKPEAHGEWGETPWVGKPVASAHLVRLLEGLPLGRRDDPVSRRTGPRTEADY